jgi:uncharacterized protein YbcI
MPDPSGPPAPPLPSADRGDLNKAVSRGLVAAKREFYGKGPEHAKTYVMDDVMMCVMRGGKTTAEDTMLQSGMKDMVRAYRQLFQNQMEERLVGMIEQLTERKVLTYQSQVLFDPFTVIEIFMFDRPLAESGGDDGPADSTG